MIVVGEFYAVFSQGRICQQQAKGNVSAFEQRQKDSDRRKNTVSISSLALLFYLEATTGHEVETIIALMDKMKSSDHGNIHNTVLKVIGHLASETLAHFFNFSI